MISRACTYLTILLVTGVSGVLTGRLLATTGAEDSASDLAYAADPTGAWKGLNSTIGENPPGNDNGGYGFGPWNFAGGYHDPDWSPYGALNHFIDGVDFPSSSFNNLDGPSFGLTNANRSFFGYTARATRTFTPLEVGSTLSIDFDNPLLQPLDPFSASGFLFRLNTGGGPVINDSPIPDVEERFGIATTSNFNGGRWYATDEQGFADTGMTAATTGSGTRFVFAQTGAETYSVSFVRLNDDAVLYSSSGMLNHPGSGAIDTIEITMFGNGSGSGIQGGVASGEREFFFNNLRITAPDSGIPGDFDSDGDVDGRDFLMWQRDASVGNLSDWQANYGLSALETHIAVIPEPMTASLILSVLLIFIKRKGWDKLDGNWRKSLRYADLGLGKPDSPPSPHGYRKSWLRRLHNR
jgi:hypothetical protein